MYVILQPTGFSLSCHVCAERAKGVLLQKKRLPQELEFVLGVVLGAMHIFTLVTPKILFEGAALDRPWPGVR